MSVITETEALIEICIKNTFFNINLKDIYFLQYSQHKQSILEWSVKWNSLKFIVTYTDG